LNWFKAKGEIALGVVVEGLNTDAKLALRKARGFRTYEVLETALYITSSGAFPRPYSPTHFVEEAKKKAPGKRRAPEEDGFPQLFAEAR
jgi:hypothetical protein